MITSERIQMDFVTVRQALDDLDKCCCMIARLLVPILGDTAYPCRASAAYFIVHLATHHSHG